MCSDCSCYQEGYDDAQDDARIKAKTGCEDVTPAELLRVLEAARDLAYAADRFSLVGLDCDRLIEVVWPEARRLDAA